MLACFAAINFNVRHSTKRRGLGELEELQTALKDENNKKKKARSLCCGCFYESIVQLFFPLFGLSFSKATSTQTSFKEKKNEFLPLSRGLQTRGTDR